MGVLGATSALSLARTTHELLLRSRSEPPWAASMQRFDASTALQAACASNRRISRARKARTASRDEVHKQSGPGPPPDLGPSLGGPLSVFHMWTLVAHRWNSLATSKKRL